MANAFAVAASQTIDTGEQAVGGKLSAAWMGASESFGLGVEVEATPTTLLVRFAPRFGAMEADRLSEILATFKPLSSVALDFKGVREFEISALLPLGTALNALYGVRVLLLGLTSSQARLLRYLEVKEPEVAKPEMRAAAPPQPIVV